MKTNINYFKHLCTLLLAALAFAACSSENDDIAGPEPVQPVNGDITFTAVFGVKNATTRALSDPNNGTLTASWQQGEQIAIVFGGTKYTATVTAVDGEGSATVSATLPSNTPNNQAVTYIYPASAADGSGLRSDLLSSQDGTLATLSSTLDVATAEGNIVIDGTNAQPNGTVTLQNQFAVCKLQFKDKKDQAINDIASLTITDLATNRVITVTTPSAQPAVYVAMLPSSNSTKFELGCNSGKNYQKTAAANLKAGMFYHPTLQVIRLYEYVNLGLYSGTLWATCNVGAENPEDYGDYFAWGETEPKSDYSWSTYKWINDGQSSWEQINKYTFADNQTSCCWYSNNEFIGDNKTELDPEDDAATANWGNDWQMPSYDQILELINNTTTTWTTQGGVYGRLFTANGRSIFLPAAGYYNDTTHENTGSHGYYWSRSLSTLFSDCAYEMLFAERANASQYDGRKKGCPIRPVRKQ